MKMNLRLGVSREALLKHPTACFRLSKAATRVSDALSFSMFYLVNSNGRGVLLPRDLHHISAGIHTTSKSADDLALLVDDPMLRKEIQDYSKQATRINNQIRRGIPDFKNKVEKKKAKAITLSEMLTKTKDLGKKAREIELKVEDLCTVTAPAVIEKPKTLVSGAMHGRAGMSGVVHKKRPMYPRYFVASMGRSRR